MCFGRGPYYDANLNRLPLHVEKISFMDIVKEIRTLPLTPGTFRFWDVWLHGKAEHYRAIVRGLVAEGHLEVRQDGSGRMFAQMPEGVAERWNRRKRGEQTDKLTYPVIVLSDRAGETIVTYGRPPARGAA